MGDCHTADMLIQNNCYEIVFHSEHLKEGFKLAVIHTSFVLVTLCDVILNKVTTNIIIVYLF